jgi:hypothetical protein
MITRQQVTDHERYTVVVNVDYFLYEKKKINESIFLSTKSYWLIFENFTFIRLDL